MSFFEVYKQNYAAGLISAGIVFMTLLTAGCAQKDAAVTMAPGGPPEVGVIEIKPQKVILTTELPGRTSAFLVAEVRPQVSGIIQKRLFAEGTMPAGFKVSKSQLSSTGVIIANYEHTGEFKTGSL